MAALRSQDLLDGFWPPAFEQLPSQQLSTVAGLLPSLRHAEICVISPKGCFHPSAPLGTIWLLLPSPMTAQFIYGGPGTPVSFHLNYLQIQGNRPEFLLALALLTVG